LYPAVPTALGLFYFLWAPLGQVKQPLSGIERCLFVLVVSLD
jgi:hypothetical protein